MKTALYYIRTRCNYSQGMVARELDVSRQMLSAWESTVYKGLHRVGI